MFLRSPLSFALLLCAGFAMASPSLPAAETDNWAAVIVEGRTALESGDAATALERFRAAWTLAQGAGHSDYDRIVSLTSLGLAYAALGRYDLAGDYHERSLALRQKVYPEQSMAVATGLRNIAAVRQRQGQLAETATLLRRALDILQAVPEESAEDRVAVGIDLASTYHGLARYRDALATYDSLDAQAAEVSVAKRINLLTGQATAHAALGDTLAAEPLLRDALGQARAELGAGDPTTATVLNSLAELLRSTGRPDESIPLYEEALAIRERDYGPRDPRVAPILNNLALAEHETGNTLAASEHIKVAFEIATVAYGDSHPAVATVLANLADIAEGAGDLRTALESSLAAVGILEAQYGPQHLEVARLKNALARRLIAVGAADEAAAQVDAARAVLEARFGHDNPEVAEAIGNQSEVARLRTDYAEALALNGEALAIMEKSLPGDSPEVAVLLSNRGALLKTMRRMPEAAEAYGASLAMRETLFGPDSLRLVRTLRDYAFVLRRLRRGDEAAVLEERAARIETDGAGV